MYTLIFGHAWNASDGEGLLDRAVETEKPKTFLEKQKCRSKKRRLKEHKLNWKTMGLSARSDLEYSGMLLP